jgi:hypothetical protein
MAEFKEQLSLVVPVGTEAKANAMLERLGQAHGVKLCKSDVYRAALERGLAVLSLTLRNAEDQE